MSDLVIYRFQPDAMDEGVLRKLFVGRTDLFSTIKNEIEKAVDNRTPRYFLIVGPRGIGKSHFITLLYYRIRQLEGSISVKLSEEEFSIYRISDFFSRIFEEIEGEKFDDNLEMDNSELVDAILEDLKSRNKMIVIFVENFNQILGEQMGESEVKRLRTIFQEENIFIVVATSPLIFTRISQGSEPFYNFFDIKHLRELTKEEIREMIGIIDKFEGKIENLELHYSKMDSITTLTGGNPRIILLLYDFMSKRDISDVENAFFKILDEYTPFYQDVFRMLTGQKRRIFDMLISIGKPGTPKEIAEAARLDYNVVVAQLRRLEKDGYVVSHKIGRNVKYEVRERLFRLWREQRQPLGRKKISIFIEFIRLWYTPEEREKEFLTIIDRLEEDTALIRKAEYFFWTLPSGSKTKLIPEITREFYEHGMLELLEELLKEDEELKHMFAYEKLEVLFKEEKYDDVLEEAEDLINKDEYNKFAWFVTGLALENLKRYEEAVQAFDSLIEIDPAHTDGWKYKGVNLVYLKRYEEAVQAFDKAIEIDPGVTDRSSYWYFRGIALLNVKRYEEALQAFNKFIEIDPEGARKLRVWYHYGVTLFDLERYEEALQAFNKLIEIDPAHTDGWQYKGKALFILQRYKEALPAFDKAIEIDPDYSYGWRAKGTTLMFLERYEEALHAFDKLIFIDPKITGEWLHWFFRGIASMYTRRYEEALQSFDKAIEIDPKCIGNWSPLTYRGLTLWILQRNEEALQSFDKAIEIDPEQTYGWRAKGIMLMSLKRYEEALQVFNKAVEISPKDALGLSDKASAHLKIAAEELKKNNYGNAVENLNSAMNSFLKIGNTRKKEIKETITAFFKDLIDSKQIEAVDISLKTIFKKEKELTEFLKHISIALEITKTKNLKKYYDLQVEERDIVVDIVRRLTESEKLLPEEYRNRGIRNS